MKFGIAFVYLGVERGSIKAFAGYGELVDECELKISQAFNLRVASGLTESRSAAARNGNRRSAKERVSNNEVFAVFGFIRRESLGLRSCARSLLYVKTRSF